MYFLVVTSVMSMIAAAVIISVSVGARMLLRHIDILVPPVAHEIDGSAAGIISVAVSVPAFRMAGGNPQVDRLSNDNVRRPNHDRPRVYDFRLRKASDVDAAIKTRLADTDGHAHIGSVSRGCEKGYQDGE
jgi:hypothetical protein